MLKKILPLKWPVLVIVVGGVAAGFFFGYSKWQNGRWGKAEELFRKADYAAAADILIKTPLPKDVDMLKIYGQTMMVTGHPGKAEEAYAKAYELKPDRSVKLLLGNAAKEQKEYDKAIDIYLKLIDANPDYIQAYVNLAGLYRLRGQSGEGVQVIKRGIENNPGSLTLWSMQASLTFNDQDSDDFKSAASKLREIDPTNPLLSQIP